MEDREQGPAMEGWALLDPRGQGSHQTAGGHPALGQHSVSGPTPDTKLWKEGGLDEATP